MNSSTDNTDCKPQPTLHVMPGRLLVTLLAEESAEEAAGLIMPGQKKDKPRRCSVVVAASTTVEGRPARVHAGDIVHISAFCGTEIKLQSQELLVIDDREVLAIEKYSA